MPLSPIRMLPAYRYGAATPWGGSKLRTLFGRALPDERTGESLEVSAIDGLNSRDEEGRTLSGLIALYGERLTGKGLSSPFPLLLKLIDARDRLSVQVHPNDAYAKRRENKLGKTEAWIILHADEGAQLVYGVRENVTKEALMNASLQGAAVERLLRFVPVKAGDAFYIPAGTVHAIGGGIVLYEIQQSSDVTYRFYDWNRMDAEGKKRELHLKKALDVTDTETRLDAVQPTPLPLCGVGRRFLALSGPFFTVERYVGCENAQLPINGVFQMATAIEETILAWKGGTLPLHPGDTALLPADSYPLLVTAGHLLVSQPVSP